MFATQTWNNRLYDEIFLVKAKRRQKKKHTDIETHVKSNVKFMDAFNAFRALLSHGVRFFWILFE